MNFVGITSSDPYLRKFEWAREGKIVANFRVVHVGLTYDQAFELELRYRAMGYVAESAGPVMDGYVYSLYTFEY